MAQFTYNNFIKSNVAPKGAASIGVYDNKGNIVGNIPIGSLQPNNEEPIYKFGLLSDIHVDTTDYNYSQYINTYPYSDEGEGDFRRAVNWLKDYEHVDMVCACGDLSQNGTASEFAMPQSVISECLPPATNIPFYTCTGNHDVKTAGGSGFGTYFLRSFEQTWSGMSNFERSSAFNESFCFDKACGSNTDHFIFFSMYSYSLGSSASPYLDTDIDWLETKLNTWKNDRVFIFTHLFFPDYAGNLGRVGGVGGIYPSGNWLGGSQLTRLSSFLSRYSNAIWFSGHSHWKWDLQKYQKNVSVAQYGIDGAWTVHVPSCALPIDSDYSNITQETTNNRVEKPLESQGGVVYVYEDSIVIRGIDFNINASQKGDTTRGYTGTDYLKYLPIAIFNLDTTLQEIGNEGEVIEPPVIVTADNIRISTSGNRADNCSQIISSTTSDNGDQITTIEFTNSNQSCVLTTDTLSASNVAYRVMYDDVAVKLKKVSDGTITIVPVDSIDNYLGWLVSYSQTDGSVYNLNKKFDYTYELTTQYSSFKYGESSTNTTDVYGVQLNTSSKLSNSANPCWIDNYLTESDRSSLDRAQTSTYHIIVEFTNLKIAGVISAGGGGETETTTYTPYTYADFNSMAVGETKEVILVNPHRNNGYILGHTGTQATSSGNGFANESAIQTALGTASTNDNLHMIITKKQDMREEVNTVDRQRTFTVSGTFNNTAIAQISNTTLSNAGYNAYGLLTTTLTNTTRTANTTITFDGTEYPRTIYVRLRKSANGATATATISNGGTGTITAVQSTTTRINTSLSDYTAITMTSNTLTISTTVKRSATNQTAGWVILVPNNIVEQETTTTQVPGDTYFTLSGKNGSYGPTGTTGSATWSTDLMHYTLSNPASLGTTTDLTSGVNASNNENLIRFTNPSNYYLNAGGGLSSLKYAQGTGEWSIWLAYNPNTTSSSSSNYIKAANFLTNTDKGSLNVSERVQDLSNGYVAVNLSAASTGFWVNPSNFVSGVQPTLVVEDLKVYSGTMVTSGTTISLPQYVGFYEGTNHSGADRYQIANGFQPSITESGSDGKLQFQASSSYTGGNITIVMKIRFTY